MITRFSAVAIYITDQRKAVDFYVNKLGMELLHDIPGGYGEEGGENTNWVEVAPTGSATHISLTPAAFAGKEPGGNAPLLMQCDNAEATAADLKAKGVEISHEVETQDWGTYFQFKDPDGNEYLVSQES